MPLHPDLQTHREAQAGQDTPDEYVVMPSLPGLESTGKRGLSRRFHQLMQDDGVDRREVTHPAGRQFAQRSFHSLRHTFVSDLANSCSHPKLRRKLNGHQTASVHDFDSHFAGETLRAAVHPIPSCPFLSFESRHGGRSQPTTVSRRDCREQASPIGDHDHDINLPDYHFMSPR